MVKGEQARRGRTFYLLLLDFGVLWVDIKVDGQYVVIVVVLYFPYINDIVFYFGDRKRGWIRQLTLLGFSNDINNIFSTQDSPSCVFCTSDYAKAYTIFRWHELLSRNDLKYTLQQSHHALPWKTTV